MRSLAVSFTAALFVTTLLSNGTAQTAEKACIYEPGIVKKDTLLSLNPTWTKKDGIAELRCRGFNMPVYRDDGTGDPKMLFVPLDKNIKFNMPVFGRDTSCRENTGE